MSHARRYHEPGVGSRTGMRVADDAFDVNEFFQAGRRAMNGESKRHSTASSRRSSVASSSSSSSEMMIVQDTSGLSPRSTIRRSLREASSSNLSSSSLGKTHDLLNEASLTGTAVKRLQDAQKNALMSIGNKSTSSTTRYSSSPSPWVVDEGENSNRRGLNAGLEARRMARLKQVQTQQSAHRIASLEQPDVGSKKGRNSSRRTSTMESEEGDMTATLLRHNDEDDDREEDEDQQQQQQSRVEERNDTELQEAVESDVDKESNSSWPAGEDAMPPEDDIEAFDGSEMQQDKMRETSNMILDDVSEADEASADEKRGDEEFSEQEEENEDDGDQGSDEEISGEDRTEDEEEVEEEEDMDIEQLSEEISISMSKSQAQSTSVDDESQDAESEVSDVESEQQEVSASQSEEETEASVDDAGDAEDAEAFAFPVDDNESINVYDDGDVTPTNAITSLVHDQSHVAEDEDPVYRRSVLTQRDSNVPRTVAIEEKKKPGKAKKRGKNQHDDDESGQERQVRHRQDGLHGEIVESVPYSQQRRLTGMESGEDGVRRGTRYRFKPLEYWRGERARYGRPSLPKSKDKERSPTADAEGDGDGDENVGDDTTIDADVFESHVRAAPPPVTVLKEIIRIPRAEGEGTFSGMKLPRKGGQHGEGTAKGPRKGATGGGKQALNPAEPTRNVEDGWDKDTQTHMTVMDAATQEEAERQIACTSDQLRPRMAVGCRFGFEKVFVVEDFMATGVMFLLVDGEKPIKNSKDNYYTFVVLEGCVRVRVHRTDFVIAPQGMFFVPRGNDYSITNISRRVARLAFTQAKSPSGRTAIGLPSSD